MDLRSAISAVSRLPYDGDKLVDLLCESEPSAANNPEDEDYSTFWLVVADQFTKRGIASDRARHQALAIIDADLDGIMRETLGASAADRRKRRQILEKLRMHVTADVPSVVPRSVLKKPQPLIMNVGDVILYPTFGGRCRNPYFALKEKDRMGTGSPSWSQDCWAAMIIVDCGRAFGFLSWYYPLTIVTATLHRPNLDELKESSWRLARAGTCSAVHFKRMEMEKIGTVQIDDAKLRALFPKMKPGTSQAVADISIANGLDVQPPLGVGQPSNTISGLSALLTSGELAN